MWWLYVPIAFDDYAIVLIIQEEPNGFRHLSTIAPIRSGDGRVRTTWLARVKIHYRSGTRIPTGATIEATDSAGAPSASTSNPSCPCLFTWAVGMAATWIGRTAPGKAFGFTGTSYARQADPGNVARSAFGVIDHVGYAVCHDDSSAQPRAGACSSTARWAAMTRPVSPTG